MYNEYDKKKIFPIKLILYGYGCAFAIPYKRDMLFYWAVFYETYPLQSV